MADRDLPDVRALYEALPYPPRDPEDERKRLVTTWVDDLPMISHYGFGGRARFDAGFRALVAGGGTGDATIYLAEQLRSTGAEVVHLDFSAASTAIAKRRAQVRGLANIRWVEASLLDLPSLGLGAFDYVNCVGVLHHLADPDAGLEALLASLAPGGAMGLMVYGSAGRAGVYQMRSLLALVNEDEPDPKARIDQARQVLSGVPPSNWFRRGEDLYTDHRTSDAGLADLLLHPQDRAYSVGELYDWLVDRRGLAIALTDVQRGRSAYVPGLIAGPQPPRVIARIAAMPERRQHEIAELWSGRIQTHSLFATRAPAAAPYGDAAFVPYLFHEPVTGPELAKVFARSRGQPFVLDHQWSGVSVRVTPGPHVPAILERIDGKRTFGEIFAQVRALPAFRGPAPDDEVLFAEFREAYEVLNAIDRLLLRHEDHPLPPRPA
ncbi:MAG: class I SAM-dependent methyltransferase [Betaproteobacteria bacterium]|nr:class I SAM-dependent methyltransferase [Betaproteobacteria bacterium]